MASGARTVWRGRRYRSVVVLWAAPRSRSTAFFRTMVDRDDLIALHEPLCNLANVGETDVAGETVRSTGELFDVLAELSRDRTVFIKDTTDHRFGEVLADDGFMSTATHTFLIRRPDRIAASYYALKPDMRVDHIGLENLYEIYRMAVAAGTPTPVVVDADDLAGAPGRTVAAYCAAVGIEFRPESLSWKPGARTEWRHSQRWHTAVSASDGLVATSSDHQQTVANNPMLARLSAHHEPFYRLLREARLIPGRE